MWKLMAIIESCSLLRRIQQPAPRAFLSEGGLHKNLQQLFFLVAGSWMLLRFASCGWAKKQSFWSPPPTPPNLGADAPPLTVLPESPAVPKEASKRQALKSVDSFVTVPPSTPLYRWGNGGPERLKPRAQGQGEVGPEPHGQATKL